MALPFTVQAQTTVASDNGDNYASGGDYTSSNEGTGFANAFTPKNFGGNDQGGTFLAETSPNASDRGIDGDRSFAIFANDAGTGAAVSRSLSSSISGGDRFRVEFLIRFDLNPNDGQTAGVVFSESTSGDQTSVFDGQRLFVGIDGSGVWGFDGGGGYTVLGDGSGGDFAASGGTIYRVKVDLIPGEDRFDMQVEEENAGTQSAIASGPLSGTSGSAVQTIGFANGVVESTQNLIFDAIEVIQDPTDPLPVELASFTASLDGTTAQLEWETLSETNNAGFEVQHAAPEGDFEAQGFVEGEGTTDTPQQYTFSVDDLAPGTHRFRLKQTDFDGTSELTEAQTIEVSLNQVAMLETAPNPVRGSGTIQFAVQEAEPVTVSVYNVLGQRVETLYDGTPTPDQVHTVSLDTSTLSSGTYFVRIEGATMQKTRRVAVVR
ncbi:MAG: T9SS type A sorting domain-containing protein [Bacteroidota bacterium]